MDTYHALIERSRPDDIHQRASVEAASLLEAKRLLEDKFGMGKVISIYSERESHRTR